MERNVEPMLLRLLVPSVFQHDGEIDRKKRRQANSFHGEEGGLRGKEREKNQELT